MLSSGLYNIVWLEAFQKETTTLISSFQCKDILLWEFPRCLTSPSLKISPETHFRDFKGWNVNECGFLLCSHFTTPTLELMPQQKALVIFPSVVSVCSPFNWTTVPSDTEVLVSIPRATPGHAQGRGPVQLRAGIICKKHKSSTWIPGTLLSCNLENFSSSSYIAISQKYHLSYAFHTCLSTFIAHFTCSHTSTMFTLTHEARVNAIWRPRRHAAQQHVIVSSRTAHKPIWQSWNLLR